MPRAHVADPLAAYRAELAHIQKLPTVEEHRLAALSRAGDPRAREALVRACLPLVVKIAVEYRKWGVPIEDIVQQGNIGLIRAVGKFDPRHGTRLSTYAAYWIRAEIREYIVRAYRLVRVGTTKAERKAIRIFRKRSEMSLDELVEASGLARARAEDLLPLLKGRETSLEAPCEDGLPFGNRLRASAESPEEKCAAQEARAQLTERVHHAMGELDARERTIVSRRFMKDEPDTLECLGNALGVSKERVRQLEARAKSKLTVSLAPPAAA